MATTMIPTHSLFPTYAFKHPQSDYVEKITEQSYWAAAFFGPFYLVFKQFWGLSILFFLVVQPAIMVGVALGMGALGGLISSLLPSVGHHNMNPLAALMVFGLAVPGYLGLTAKLTIAAAVKGYLRAGWQQQ